MNMSDSALTALKMALVAARERGEPDALANVLQQHPAYADALTEFDLGLVATSSYDVEADAPDVLEIAQRARQRVFARAIGEQTAAATQVAPQQALTLKALREARQRTLSAVATTIGLGMDVLSALESGRIRLTSVPQRVYQALAEALDATAEQISGALAYQVSPALRRGQPGARSISNQQIDFADAVMSSQSMTQEQRAAWLAESFDV